MTEKHNPTSMGMGVAPGLSGLGSQCPCCLLPEGASVSRLRAKGRKWRQRRTEFIQKSEMARG